MKVLIAICIFGFALSAPQRGLLDGYSLYVGKRIVIPYNYGYEIKDPETMNFQNKAEMMDDQGNVFGSYSVYLPDGIIYTTSYNVTRDSGYVVEVTKILATFRKRL